jgi:adenylylsulfate kinase
MSKGTIVWLTGLSGAGKSTIGGELLSHFHEMNLNAELLDGDEIRELLSKGLGFSKEDRDLNIRRIGYVARLLARNGVLAITAAISPYREIRDEVRRLAALDGVRFVEVYLNPSLDSLIARDTKGLYRKALAGEISHFTGISDPYEPPLNPQIEIHTDTQSVEDSVEFIMKYLQEEGLIPCPEEKARTAYY